MVTTIHSTSPAVSSTALLNGYGVKLPPSCGFLLESGSSLSQFNPRLSFTLTKADSGAHQIVWAALGLPEIAVADLRSMLQYQLDDGRIPQQINWQHKAGWADPLKPRLYSRDDYNDLTQMPVLPYSLRSIYNVTSDVELLKEIVPKLVKYFDWWRNTRALDDTGLVTILHPWESGLDLTPAYDAALGVSEKQRARPSWSAM
jgi:hypothetical protein